MARTLENRSLCDCHQRPILVVVLSCYPGLVAQIESRGSGSSFFVTHVKDQLGAAVSLSS